MKVALAVTLSLFSCAISFAALGQGKTSEKPPTAVEQSAMDAEKSFIVAAKKGDAAFFKRTLSDDFSFVSFDGKVYERQAMIDQYGEPGTEILPYEMKVLIPGDGVAIVPYNVVLRVPPVEDQ